MKSDAEKALDLIVRLDEANENYKSLTDQIGNHLALCPRTIYLDAEPYGCYRHAPHMNEWLKPQIISHTKYFAAQNATEEECPHCYAALKLIEKRKQVRIDRGHIKGAITKLSRKVRRAA
ncbi:TPA: hypothetical protein U2K45_000317 [Acinetobacter baumannii]|nr:hypothetical protein [Acinetobacter baumannii]